MDEQTEKIHEKKKKGLIEKLLERVYDKHAFGRSQTLKILHKLCDENEGSVWIKLNYAFRILYFFFFFIYLFKSTIKYKNMLT